MKEIILFDKVLIEKERTTNDLTPGELQTLERALKKGIIVNPKANMFRVQNYLDTLIDKPTTLFSSFEKVRQTADEILLMETLQHYASTYGTDYSGEVYLPSIGNCAVDLKDHRYLDVMTYGEISDRIDTLATKSGIAMSNNQITDILTLITELKTKGYRIPWIYGVKNNELRIRMMLEYWEKPDNLDEMMKMIHFILTDNACVVKNDEACYLYRTRISENHAKVLELMNHFDMEEVSSIFNRYKRLFLAMKQDGRMINYINKLSKLSKKHHKPMDIPFVSTFLTDKVLLSFPLQSAWYDTRYRHIFEGASVFQLEKWRRAVTKRLIRAEAIPGSYWDNIYNIRNGKIFVKGSNVPNYENSDKQMLIGRYRRLERKLKNLLAERLSEKLSTWTVSSELDYALPTTMKDFIGHLPYGTAVPIGDWKNIQVGIYWEGKNGANDLDLSLDCTDGTQIAWNRSFKSDGITHSGDMTSANPSAAEIISITEQIPASRIVVNAFNSEPNAKFRFFIAKNADTYHQGKDLAIELLNQQHNPNILVFDCELEITGQMNIGYIDCDGTFYFSGRVSDNTRTMTGSRWSGPQTKAEIDHMKTFTRISEIVGSINYERDADDPMFNLSHRRKTELVELLS